MKKCVEALTAAGDDIEEAVTVLRKAGLAAAQKKASRGASEGGVAIAHGPLGAALVEINSETDFVARNDLFQTLAVSTASTALHGAGAAGDMGPVTQLDTSAIGASVLVGTTDAKSASTSVTEAMGVAVSQLGENLVLRRACLLRNPDEGGVVASYVHNAYAPGVGRTAAAVVLRSNATDTAALRTLGEQLSMHVVAATPRFLDRSSVDEAAVARERDILAEQAKASGKAEDVIAKMVEGRLKKFYGEACLLEQTYLIEENAGTVAKVLAAAGTSLGAPVTIEGFVRFHVGEASGSADE